MADTTTEIVPCALPQAGAGHDRVLCYRVSSPWRRQGQTVHDTLRLLRDDLAAPRIFEYVGRSRVHVHTYACERYVQPYMLPCGGAGGWAGR